MKETRLENYGEGGYRIYRVPSIVCTPKGTLIVCYECRYGGDWSAMDLVIRRSTDGGQSWSERRLIDSGHEIDVVHNGVMFADGNQVHLVWHRNYRQGFCITSYDEGETWSNPSEVTPAYEKLREQYNWTVIAAGPGHGLTTSGGRLLIPVWVAANRADITNHHPSVVTTLYSDDHGENWQCGEIIWGSDDFADPNESILAELPDGRIMMNSRHETGTGYRKVGFSPDGISQWCEFKTESQLRDPVCAAGMAQGNGKLWFSNCDCERQEGRIRLSVKQSDDRGKTWRQVREIAETGGYSDLLYCESNGMLHVVAETGRATEETFSFGISVFSLSVLDG